jgi:thioesterase domain-containing protein
LAAAGDAAAPAAPRTPSLVVPLEQAQPIFCVGGVQGSTQHLRAFARALGTGHAVYGLQAPGYDGREPPLASIAELAQRHVAEVRAVQPHGPYRLAGHSFGGVIAYEIARVLQAAGETVESVLLLDAYLPVPGQRVPPCDSAAAIEELLTMHRYMYGGEGELAVDAAMPLSEQCRSLSRAMGIPDSARVEEHIANVLGVYEASLQAIVEYEPVAADLPVTLFKAARGFPQVLKGERSVMLYFDDPHNGWERVSLPGLRTVRVDGDHFDMLVEPHVQRLAEAARTHVAPAGRWQ